MKAIATIVGTGDTLPPGTLARILEGAGPDPSIDEEPYATITGFSLAEMEDARQFVAAHPGNTTWHSWICLQERRITQTSRVQIPQILHCLHQPA